MGCGWSETSVCARSMKRLSKALLHKKTFTLLNNRRSALSSLTEGTSPCANLSHHRLPQHQSGHRSRQKQQQQMLFGRFLRTQRRSYLVVAKRIAQGLQIFRAQPCNLPTSLVKQCKGVLTTARGRANTRFNYCFGNGASLQRSAASSHRWPIRTKKCLL